MSRLYRPSLFFLVLFLALSLSLVSGRGGSSNYGKGKNKYDEVQVLEETTMSEDVAVMEKKPASSTDASRMTWAEILNKFGLNIPTYMVDLLDHAVDTFEEHTKDSEFNAGNAVVAALKASLRKTLDPAMKAKNPPSGSLQPVTVDELFDVMQSHFVDIMSDDHHVSRSRLKPYVAKYVNDFFKSLKDMYRAGYAVGLSINWTVIFMIMQYLDLVPTDIFFRDSFQELLQVPGTLKQGLHDFLEEMLSGDQAHFVRMILSFVQTIDWQRMFRNEKVEL